MMMWLPASSPVFAATDPHHVRAITAWKKANALKKQGKHLQAARLFDQAAESEAKARRPKWRDMSVERNQAGLSYQDAGRLSLALKRYQQALTLARRAGKKEWIPSFLNNMGAVYQAQGHYARAIDRYQRALKGYRTLGKRRSEASALNNIGMVFRSWGKHDQALDHYQRAMALIEGTGESGLKGIFINNIGMIHQLQGRHEQARDHFSRALGLAQNKNDRATRTSNLGMALEKLGWPDEALERYRQALALDRSLGRRIDIAIDLNNIGGILKQRGQLDAAIVTFEEALSLARTSGARPQEAIILRNLGAVRLFQKRPEEASRLFKEAITLFEALRNTSKGETRRDYLEAKLETYQSLVVSSWQQGRIVDACDAAENYRARLLGEKLLESSNRSLPSRTVHASQRSLPTNTAILMFANADWRSPLLCSIQADGVRMKELKLESFLNAADQLWQRTREPFAFPETGPLRRGLKPVQKAAQRQLANRFASYIHRYRTLLMDPDSDRQRLAALSRLFHDLLLGPIQTEIANLDRLIILPDGMLSLIPFETLINPRHRFLVETHYILYGPSLGALALLDERTHPRSRRSLLAVGGVHYRRLPTGPTLDKQQVYRLAKLRFRTRAPMADLYSSLLDVNRLPDLPGSLTEVEKITAAIADSRMITGHHASERWIKQASRRGELENYRVVHLATHGLTVPEAPHLSALAFANGDAPNDEDGFLQMEEIAQLRLAADFVNLSACETGLGRLYGGEGVVGLSQAFLSAGANALSATLWPVADEATVTFMDTFYRLARAENRPLSEAMARIKRRFLRGTFGLEWQHPYFWAPFLLYGQDGHLLATNEE